MADESEKNCPNCGTANTPDAKFCRNCGSSLEAASQGDRGSDISQEITRITDPLLSKAAGPPRELLTTSIEQILLQAGPRQAEVLRRCAIPHWFDQGVLAVLRDKIEGNDRVIELLRGYSFVRPLDGDRYTYHDEVRETLLEEWRRQRAEELKQINQALANYFRERATKLMPTRSLPKAPAATTVAISEGGDWELYQREALYHTLQADQQEGMAALDEAFNGAELSHRLGDAEALLQLTRNVPLDEANKRQVRFMRARLERAALDLGAAEARLDGLLVLSDLDPVLEARAQQTLGEIYAETARWVRATELYRRARATFESHNRLPEAAETWRLLGEAYQELGASTGGWHVPAYPQSRFWRTLGEIWSWLLSLPFYITNLVLRTSGVRLPLPSYLASYRNWTLIWLYRTAAACYEKARAIFNTQGDDLGLLRAERQLADITRLFGYPAAALAQIDQAKTRAAAQDPYRQAWLDWVRAAALLDRGDVAEAQPIVETIVGRFRGVGDVRREAAALGLKARLAARRNDYDQALAIYQRCLDSFRALGAVAIRELALYDLRALRRQVGPGQTSRRIGQMLAAEPEKRYVARFPHSQLPLLRVLSIVALPLALLLLAVFGPQGSIVQVAQLASLQNTVDPLRSLLVLLILVAIYLGVYALVATAVITFVPLGDLDREQPDYFVTNPQGITRYDFRGALAQHLGWGEIDRWLRVERKLWVRPVSLLSGAYLVSRVADSIAIDGITGWYLSLQEDIDHRLQAAGSQVHAEDFGFQVIRSRSGATAIAGTLLLLLFIWSQNAWAQWLVALLPTQLYAALSLLAFSGLLLLIPAAYWLAINPLELRRTLGFRDYYPFAVLLAGLGMIAVGVLGLIPRVPSLNFGLVVTGALLCGYALSVIVAAANRSLRIIVTTTALVLSLLYVGLTALPAFNLLLTRVGADRAVLSAAPAARAESAQTSIDASQRVLNDPNAPASFRAQAYINQGQSHYAVGNWQAAIEAFTRALEIYDTLPESEAKTQGQAVAHYNRYRAIHDGGGDGWRPDRDEACRLVPTIGDCAQ